MNAYHATLRPYEPEDADAVARALEDKELLRWLAALSIPLEPDDRDNYLEFLGDPDVCASVVCVDGIPVGSVSLGTELSFWIARKFHGQGLGLWAVRRFLKQIPKSHGPITACCMRDNLSATAILDRLDFQCTQTPFRRFSFAHGHAVEFLRYLLSRPAGM